MLRIRKFGENSCGYNAALWNCRSVLRGYATMSFRQGYAYDPSLTVWDALPFNPLMRNFKRNSVFYERERRAFDRIELRRRSRRKDENSKRDRRSRADSVETSRTTTVVCVPLKTPKSLNIAQLNIKILLNEICEFHLMTIDIHMK